MSLLDQMIAAADRAEAPAPAPQAAAPPPKAATISVAEPAPADPAPAPKTRKPRAKKDPSAPPAKRGRKPAAAAEPPKPTPETPPIPDDIFGDFADEAPPDLGEDFEEILSERKPRVIPPAEAPPGKPALRPVEGSRREARREALLARLEEIQSQTGDGEPPEQVREELGFIFGELDELEGRPDPEADPFGGAQLREPEEPEDPAEREKLVASIGALAAMCEYDLPKGWQKKPSTELRSLQLQLKQEKQSSVVKNIVRRGYFSCTALLECVGPMIPVGERGLECQGLTECLEKDSSVLDALDLVSLELEETYKEYMSPWTLLAVATAAAAGKLHSTNRSIRLAAREIPPDLEARLRRIKPPGSQPGSQPPATQPAPPAGAQAAAQPAPQPPKPAEVPQTGAKPSALDGFRNLGFK